MLERACPECGVDAVGDRGDRGGGHDPRAMPTRGLSCSVRPADASAPAAGRPIDGRRWSTPPTCATCSVLYRYRLGLMIDHDDPLFPNWDQDETAVAERYNEQDPVVVSADLVAAGGRAGGRVRCGGRRPVASHGSSQRRCVVHDRLVRPLPDPRPGAPSVGRGRRPRVGDAAVDSRRSPMTRGPTVECTPARASLVDAARRPVRADRSPLRRRRTAAPSADADRQGAGRCRPDAPVRAGGVRRARGRPDDDGRGDRDGRSGRRCRRVVHDDRLDDVVDVVVPAGGRGARRSTATGRRSPGGVFAPNGRGVSATRNGVDGFEVTGRWAWGSGTQHCRWVLGGASCDDGTFRLCWMPQSEITFHDTWHTSGMRGSGSLDYSVEAVFAPAERTIQPGVTQPVVDGALARFPNFGLLAAGVSAVGLGIARRALDEVDRRSRRARSRSTRRGRWPRVASRRSRSPGPTRACGRRGRSCSSELSSAWATVEVGLAGLDRRQRIGIRSAAVHAATVVRRGHRRRVHARRRHGRVRHEPARPVAARRARRHPTHPDRPEAERDDRQAPPRHRRRHQHVLSRVLSPSFHVCDKIFEDRVLRNLVANVEIGTVGRVG